MLKALLVLLVVGVAMWLLIVRNRKLGDDEAGAEPASKAAKAAKAAKADKAPKMIDMVECAHCGLHLPAADALMSGTRVFCGEAHRQAGPR